MRREDDDDDDEVSYGSAMCLKFLQFKPVWCHSYRSAIRHSLDDVDRYVAGIVLFIPHHGFMAFLPSFAVAFRLSQPKLPLIPTLAKTKTQRQYNQSI